MQKITFEIGLFAVRTWHTTGTDVRYEMYL